MHRGVKVDGSAIRQRRKWKGWSQVRLACAAGVAERTVRNAEKGAVVEAHIANYLAIALDLPLNEIVAERPDFSRCKRCHKLIKQFSVWYIRAALEGLMFATDLLHPSIEWNCVAAPQSALLGQFVGKSNLETHLARMSRWWEQFAVQPRDFARRRMDAEGDMVYFQLVANFHDEAGTSVEIWQTFVCRLEVDMFVAVDQYIGQSPTVVGGDQRLHRQGTGKESTIVRRTAR